MISITDEEESLVDAFIEEFGVTHPVVILKGGQLESLIGVQGFPTSAVFTNGELTWTGHPSEAGSAVSKALSSAKKGSIYPKALSKVRGLMRDGRQDAAYAEILKNEGKYDAETAAWAGRVKTYLEQQAGLAFARAKEQAEAGLLYRATRTVGGYAGKDSPLPQAPEIQEWLAGLEAATPDWKKEMSGGEDFEAAAEMEKALQFEDAFEAYKRVAKKSKDTRIGANAEAAAKTILDGRKAGYNPNCEHCDAKTHMACLKHAAKIKL